MSKYQDNIKMLANEDVTEVQRAEQVVRDMAKVIDVIMGYKYTVDHYKGEAVGILQDEVNKIKNVLAVLKCDLDIMMEQFCIMEAVIEQAEKRIEKVVNKVTKRKTNT